MGNSRWGDLNQASTDEGVLIDLTSAARARRHQAPRKHFAPSG